MFGAKAGTRNGWDCGKRLVIKTLKKKLGKRLESSELIISDSKKQSDQIVQGLRYKLERIRVR